MSLSSPLLAALPNRLRLAHSLPDDLFRDTVACKCRSNGVKRVMMSSCNCCCCCKVAVSATQRQSMSGEQYRQLLSRSSCSPADFAAFFNAVLVLLRHLMRLPLQASKVEKHRKDLVTELR